MNQAVQPQYGYDDEIDLDANVSDFIEIVEVNRAIFLITVVVVGNVTFSLYQKNTGVIPCSPLRPKGVLLKPLAKLAWSEM